MRRVIQKTVTTTRIVSLTITHSDSEEAVEYTLVDGLDHANGPLAPASDQAVEDHGAAVRAANDELPQATLDIAEDGKPTSAE